MSDTQEAIRRLSIESKTVGVTQSTAELNALAQAQGGVAVASAATERASLSLDQKFSQLERRYNSQVRASQDYEKVQRQVNAAVAQNPALQERANQILAAAADRYGQVGGAQKAFGIATQTLNLQVAALAGNLGVTGQVLSAFGPLGFAAAVGLGAVSSVLSFVSDQSHALAQKAKEISEFSEATGLTVRQFQALRSEAGKFGVDSESLSAGVSKFTAGFNELRLGQGQLLTDIRKINPALADQMQQATDAATAFTLFGRAVAQTDNIFQRNALLKSGLGKGSATFGAFFAAGPDVAALTAAFDAAGKGIDENLIKKLKQLQIDIDKTRSAASTTFATAFGTSTLEAEKQYAELLLDIAKTFKFIAGIQFPKFPEAPDWVVNYLKLGARNALSLTPIGPAIAVAGLASGARDLVRAGAAANDRGALSTANFQSPANNYSTFQSSTPLGAKTDQAKLADIEKTISMLGSAATASERYEAAILKLKIGQDGYTLSTKDRARAEDSLRLDRDGSTIGARVSALGAAASATDVLAQKTNALAQANRAGAALTPAEIANQVRLTREQANGVGAVNAQIDALQIQTQTIGMTAGAAAEFTAIETKRREDLRNGKPVDEAATAALRERAKALGEIAQANERARVNNQIAFDRQTALLSPQDVAIAQQLRGIYKDIPTSLGSAEAAAIRFNDALKSVSDIARNSAASFSVDLVNGLVQGKSLMEALGGAARNLSTQLTSGAFTSLFKGDFLAAGLQGAGAIISGIFGAAQAERDAQQKAAEEAAADALSRVKSYQQRAQAAAIDTSTLVGQLDELNKRFEQERYDEAKKGNTAILELDRAQAAERTALVDKAVKDSQVAFDALVQQSKSATQSAVKNLTDATSNLAAALTALGHGIADLSGGVTAAIAKLQADFAQGLLAKINQAAGADYLSTLGDLVRQQQQDLKDAAALGINVSLVNQAFFSQAQKVIDDAQLTGAAFDQILTVFPALVGTAHAFTGAAKASVSALSDFIVKIGDFRKSLLINDQLSTLSPAQRYAEAQSQFRDVLAKANTGDAAAQSNLQGAVTAYLNESKSFNASSSQYAADFAEVQSALSGSQIAAQTQINYAAQQLAQLIALNKNVISLASSIANPAAATTAATDVNAAAAAAAAAIEAAKTWHYPAINPYYSGPATSNGGWNSADYARYQSEHPAARYQMGGLVANGNWNQDSVRALLAGGEYMTRAPSVNAQTLPVLQHINVTGSLPSNDNGQWRQLAQAFRQVSGADTDRLISVLERVIDELALAPAKSKDAVRQLAHQTKPRAAQSN